MRTGVYCTEESLRASISIQLLGSFLLLGLSFQLIPVNDLQPGKVEIGCCITGVLHVLCV